MQIANIPITDIRPYPGNPRKNEGAIKKTVSSIREFGFQQPIVVDKDGVIIAGHTRYKAALELGLEEVPVVKAINLTDQQVKAYRIADNKVGELAVWDDLLLSAELLELSSEGYDIELTGFDIPEVDDLLNGCEDDKGLSDDIPSDDNYTEQFGVIIMCESESHQEQVFNEMSSGGYNCKVVTT